MDNLDPRDAGREEASTPSKPTEPEPTLTDREIPLSSAHTPEAIHAWLDGESVSETQLKAAETEYAFWRKVEAETGKRRRIMTPTSLPAQIMKAIKDD